MNTLANPIPPRLAVLEYPPSALERPDADVAMMSNETKPIGEMLASLIHDESALYAITREWRYDTAGRRFLRLHALLDEQFSEIGIRLTRLAARSRDLGASNSAGHETRAMQPRSPVAGDALQAHMIREILGLHEALIASLKHGSVSVSGQFHDGETTDLLADLTANHEKDAFKLRALLWEVQNSGA